jgi:hypothetical protein
MVQIQAWLNQHDNAVVAGCLLLVAVALIWSLAATAQARIARRGR